MMTSEQVPKCVWNGKRWYTSHRLNGMRCVCVQWWDDNSITTEPVCNLIDFQEETVNEKMIPILLNWKISVEENLCYSRLCAFCNCNRNKSSFLCNKCTENTKWLDNLIEKERILRENRYINDIEFKITKETLFKNYQKQSPVPDLNKILVKEKICEIQENLRALDLLIN